jgi:hypothetical protein
MANGLKRLRPTTTPWQWPMHAAGAQLRRPRGAEEAVAHCGSAAAPTREGSGKGTTTRWCGC